MIYVLLVLVISKYIMKYLWFSIVYVFIAEKIFLLLIYLAFVYPAILMYEYINWTLWYYWTNSVFSRSNFLLSVVAGAISDKVKNVFYKFWRKCYSIHETYIVISNIDFLRWIITKYVITILFPFMI